MSRCLFSNKRLTKTNSFPGLIASIYCINFINALIIISDASSSYKQCIQIVIVPYHIRYNEMVLETRRATPFYKCWYFIANSVLFYIEQH